MNQTENGVDYWFMTGCGFVFLIYLTMVGSILILSKRQQASGELERKRAIKRLLIVFTLLNFVAVAIMFLTAHHGQMLRTLLGYAA